MKMAICIDFLDDLIYTAFNEYSLFRLFSLYRSWGISRIYWIYTFKHSDGYFSLLPYRNVSENAEKTYQNIGEFLPFVVKLAHRCGMELYAVYKPFDLAFNLYGGLSFNNEKSIKYGNLDRSLSGKVYWFVNSIVPLKKQRMQRRIIENLEEIENMVIKRITISSSSCQEIRINKNHIKLLISDDNCNYRNYRKDFDLYKKYKNNIGILNIDNLDISSKYFVICIPFRDVEKSGIVNN